MRDVFERRERLKELKKNIHKEDEDIWMAFELDIVDLVQSAKIFGSLKIAVSPKPLNPAKMFLKCFSVKGLYLVSLSQIVLKIAKPSDHN